ncbi:homeostatic response regulator transcription factor HsrA [Helicobacter trogontum]|uniref:Homeostatic response regulator HsrA n=1 Tax=Helicobacter trogontum TaxID=50960 RepID=A0A099VP72_9HELI|nr:homeostatic response regulator transcription factor HsrA [Helicobacter trogontum]MCI5786834.1 homeostatic response regulator transcription factor HsrA [Helicobacter trogontum]MDY5184323.1 homeostatic response regulator transcription factor HsrA [Helicobacter trogontum]TLD83440.1 response regulator transcription factor [Helicobacter trogontum]TLD98013.1 response regulator transcription factor [Helicobacter trogontum]
MRILVVYSKKDVLDCISKELDKKNYQVDVAQNVKDGEYHISVRSYDVVLGEWQLSDGGAQDIISIVKGKYPKIPVIILGDNEPKHEVQSFKHGADDYISYPFDNEVLLARIQARLRLTDSNLIEIGDIVIIPDEERITFKGKDIEVKGKPFEVLTHLARQRDQIVSKDQLLNAIWDEPELVTPNVIEVAINQIRQRMDKPLNINTIETVRRRGYRFCYPKK